jgi:replicative DNA helicase
MTTTAERLAMRQGLPGSPEAERELVGSILNLRNIPPGVQSEPADFSVTRWRRVFEAEKTLADLGRPIFAVSVADVLKTQGHLESVGGMTVLSDLDDITATEWTVKECDRLVCQAALRRRLVHVANMVAIEACEGREPASEIIRSAIAQLEAAESPDSLDHKRFTLGAIEKEYQYHADHIDDNRIEFGPRKLDELTGGLGFGKVMTMMARTGVGKTALAQNFIDWVLHRYAQLGVVFFSLELPRLQAYERQLQIRAGVNRDMVLWSYRNDRSRIPADAFVSDCANRLLIVDDAQIGLEGIRRFVRGAAAAKLVLPVKFIVIDYLGFLDRGGRANITERISVLAREVKQVAKDLNVAVLLIAQTSRTAGDGSEEVTVTDARDSGAIEDSADFLIGCWRPELRKGIGPDEYAQVRGQLWFSMLKNRRGPRDKFWLPFEGKTLRIGAAQ